MVYVNEALLGNPITQSAPYIAILLVFTLLQFFVGHRLHMAFVNQNYPRD